MRPLEIAGAGSLLLAALSLCFGLGEQKAIYGFLLCAAVLAIACHCWLEGCRWQMAPAYVVAFGLILYECIQVSTGIHTPWLVPTFPRK